MSKKYLKVLLVWSILFLLNLSSTSGERLHLPYSIKNLKISSPYQIDDTENRHQNWCIVQDSKGLIYCANQSGLLIYDGVEWRKLEIPNKSVRSLAIDSRDRLYIGGRNEFGYLNRDFKYQSLSEKLEKQFRNFSYVWQTVKDEEGNIYFRTSKFLFKYIDKKLHTYRPETFISGLYSVDGNPFYHENSKGVYKIEKLKHKTVLKDSWVLKEKIYFLNRYRRDSYILGIKNRGLFELNGKTVTPLNRAISEKLVRNKLYFSTPLNEETIAVSTLRKGITLLNLNSYKNFNINEAKGLSDNDAKHIFIDKDKRAWISLNSGISRIETAPVKKFFRSKHKILSINRLGNNIICGTTKGILKLKKGLAYSSLNSIDKSENCWDIKRCLKKTLIATGNSLVVKEISRKIYNKAVFIVQLSKDRKRLWCGVRNGLISFIYEEGKFELEKRYEGINIPIRTIVESINNCLWLGTWTRGIYQIKFPVKNKKIDIKNLSIRRFYTKQGLPKGEINVYNIAGEVVFTTSKGLYKFDEESEKFVPNDLLGKQFCDGSRKIFRLVEDKKGNIWFYSNKEFFKAEALGNGKYKIISKPFKGFPRVQTNVIYPDGDIVWFGTNEGLIRYDTTVEKDYNRSFNTLITRMASGEEELFLGYTQDNRQEAVLPWEKRNLWFTYASPYFEDEKKTTYQYRLLGSDKEEWSPFKKRAKKEFSNLEPGTYTFEVRGRNVYETVGKTAKFRFCILPPWYRTWWGWTIWTLLLIGLIYLFTVLRSRKLVKEKRELEQVIKDRTKEIREKNLLLENQTDQLMEMDRIKSSFFANISHEFRTPLTLITGPVEGLLESKNSPKERETLKMVIRNSRHLLNLINQLLDLSKLENATLGLSPKVENLSGFLHQICESFKGVAEISSKTLIYNSTDEALKISFDREKLRQIMVNLLSNAMKFTNRGDSIKVELSCCVGGFVTVKVEDTGTGIEEKDLPRIFDRFYQSEQGKDFGGTGIGLALSRELARLHGGDIRVDSNPGKGSIFILTLPATTIGEDLPTEDAQIEEELLFTESTEDFHEERLENEDQENSLPILLIVDDNRDIRSYISSTLSDHFHVVEGSNGKEGLEIALEKIPDIIISDIMMPIMDGYQLCKEVKSNKNTSHIPLIMLTAKASEESEMEGLAFGAEDYIRKPFNPEILKSRCLNLINLRKQVQTRIKNELLMQPSEVSVSSMDDQFLKEVHQIIETNLADPEFNVEQLCKKLYMSRTTVYRKIQALTGDSPTQFVRSFRIKRGAQLIKAKAGTITEIAFMTGFSSSAYFTKCFKEQFHHLPSDYG